MTKFARRPRLLFTAVGVCVVGGMAVYLLLPRTAGSIPAASREEGKRAEARRTVPRIDYKPREAIDSSGFSLMVSAIEPWTADTSLNEIAKGWRGLGHRGIVKIDKTLATAKNLVERVKLLLKKASYFNYDGEPERAYELLTEARAEVERDPAAAAQTLYSIVFFQGVCALRRGENDNCIMCRGESSCILPISPAAVHTNPEGSRLAIAHFTEYLRAFPEDLDVRWLLNLAHMTLGEHPDKVDPKYVLSIDRFRKSEFDIGKFRDIGHIAGVNRFGQAGGAIMDDFDGDGLLDLAVTCVDPTMPISLFHNQGDGTFEDRAETAGLADQLGGLNCAQGDYNNDGYLDLFIARGAWLSLPIRPSLLRNNGDGTFTDVTKEAGMLDPVNSNCATWTDYDNDGFLDLFVCCELQKSHLYHSRRDGTFEEVAASAGLPVSGLDYCKGAAWIDFDNDDFPDLFLNHLNRSAQLFHNDRAGHFTEVTLPMGVNGPQAGFSCWAWDYDNDGWLDIFATSYDRTLGDVVKGLLGQPHKLSSNRLFRNLEGKGFDDRTAVAGLDMVFATMGSNYGDFDNDGFLDMYLGTGEPTLSMLVPNRMFKNVAGRRFAEITGTSGTGHLQKGHGVACGDWDRDGAVDVFIEMGGAVNGDKYHSVLFQNPGQTNHRLTLKLVGRKSNRSAIGARVKVVTAGDEPLTVQRHVSSGSSFGGNPLEQHIGLGNARHVARLEVRWPTSETTQVLYDIDADQAIEVTELEEGYRVLNWKPINKKK